MSACANCGTAAGVDCHAACPKPRPAIYTARVSTRDPDRLDITRKSGKGDGLAFAPSWAILTPALNARRKTQQIREIAEGTFAPEILGPAGPEARERYLARADDLERRTWDAYVPAYTAEMRESYRHHPDAWRGLLARPRIVLVCYCVDPARCHRTLLADILGKLGADVRGELP